ncbi:SET and MYND domain-containing protein 3 [Boothiomyces macroporosus]|uniref:SET and MYND domain-containing protein 3 n=1 Tax=Boothiomyces macroporosus TaxID=261099 RepID=A0AAD5UI03_9FUNG|nr:SET and MYND domain-containing protein 3 [Boothiomyces macroporosus]
MHLVATQPIAPGTLIMQEPPLACVVDDDKLNLLCSTCFRENAELRCSSCTVNHYCNVSCQRKDWKIHKLECKGFKKIAPNIPNISTRIISRILYLAYLQPSVLDGVGQAGKRKQEGLGSLLSHKSDIPQDALIAFGNIIYRLKFIMEHEQLRPASTMMELYCIYASNCMAVCNDEYVNTGVALYPLLSSVNHSCKANACVVFDGPQAKLISCQPINAGEQIFISYVESFTGIAPRKSLLKSNYFFDCRCEWCTGNDPFGFIRCKCGEKANNHAECANCGRLNNIPSLEIKDPTISTAMLEELYLNAKRQLWDTNSELFEIRREYFHRVLRDQSYEKCYKLAIELANSFVEVYGEWYPLTSIYNYYVFKTAQHVYNAEAMEAAKLYGTKACSTLKSTHGGLLYERANQELRMFIADMNMYRK